MRRLLFLLFCLTIHTVGYAEREAEMLLRPKKVAKVTDEDLCPQAIDGISYKIVCEQEHNHAYICNYEEKEKYTSNTLTFPSTSRTLTSHPVSISWDYCGDDENSGYGLLYGWPDHDVEFAIRVPSEQITAYQGCQITTIEFYAWNGTDESKNVEYVFITKRGTDYLVKLPVSTIFGEWTIAELPQPYTITGDELFVGLGRHDKLTMPYANKKNTSDGFWVRGMGENTNGGTPGEWSTISNSHPLPLRFRIQGEKIPSDVLLEGTQQVEKDLRLQTTVRSRTPETINTLKFDWLIDGQESGSQTFETNLLPNHEETFLIDMPSSIQGSHHKVMVNVSEINGVPDEINSNSCEEVNVTWSTSHYPRKIVMEEGTGTWCGWCVRGIETINRLNKEYPDNFIAIGIHNNDEMSNAVNYNTLLSKFDHCPNSFVNRIIEMNPSYDDMKALVESKKNNAIAMITAKAFFISRDALTVKVETETTFGFSDSEGSNYRIAYVVVEDSVGPYNQKNYYSNYAAEEWMEEWMEEWAHKGRQVEMLFNDVARGIYSYYEGTANSFPSTINESETYRYSYTFYLPKNIQNKKNIRIITLLIDVNSGEILNADQTTIDEVPVNSIEAYNVLSNNNTTLTFYYDDQIVERGGVSIIPYSNDYDREWSEMANLITTVVFDESFADARPTSTCYWFRDCSELTKIQGIEHLNTSEVTDMRAMFSRCESLTDLDLSYFDTSNVTIMTNMFSRCESLTNLDLSHFDTSNVTNMSAMFSRCESLTNLDLSHFDTNNVVYMSNMFNLCHNLNNIYVNNKWTTENVKTKQRLFGECFNLIGGQGTRYDQNHIDQTYARIDGGESAPGYFTYKPLSGDANGDEIVNAADIVEVVNYIMGQPSGAFDISAADLNGDGVVNAADIVAMVNIIMSAK